MNQDIENIKEQLEQVIKKKRDEVHVMPYCDCEKYKNGKLKTKWIVVINPKRE